MSVDGIPFRGADDADSLSLCLRMVSLFEVQVMLCEVNFLIDISSNRRLQEHRSLFMVVRSSKYECSHGHDIVYNTFNTWTQYCEQYQ